MQFVAVQEITITKQAAIKGSTRVVYNVDLNGVPFGQIWTYKFPGEKHVWHAAKATGELIGNGHVSYKAAETAMRGAM